jgi:uncharacterized protein (TIGR03790 family)
MKNKEKYLFLTIIIFLTVAQVNALTYYNNYSDIVILCNKNSEISQEICNYFLQERADLGFSEENIINITNVTTDETINTSEYFKILEQVNSSIRTLENLGKVINYIITTKEIPLRTGLGYSCDTFVNNVIPSECKSVDSRLMADLGATTNYASKTSNYIKSKFNHTQYGGYLITRLDGINIADIKQLIDSSTQAKQTGLSGKALLNCYTNNTNLESYNSNCLNAKTTIEQKNYETILNSTSFIRDAHNLSGYVSWGSNADNTLIARNSSAWNFSFNPGALAETYVSTSGRTFNLYPYNGSGPFGGQSLISDLIKYNITGVKGYVYEPFTSALANVNVLWERYLSGYNLADSFYMASEYRNWTDVIIGDPKTSVIPQSTNNPVTLSGILNGERISNGTIIKFTIESNDFWEIDSTWYTINNGEINYSFEENQDILVDSLGPYGEYNITVYINDTEGNEDSKEYNFIFNTTVGITPIYSKFNGNETTDIKTLENREEVNNLVLEIEGIGKIEFYNTLNLSNLNLNELIDLENNFLYIDEQYLSTDFAYANITFYNMPQNIQAPRIFKNDENCEDCKNFTELNLEEVKFNITGFSKYTIQNETETSISSCQQIRYPGRYKITNNIANYATCLNISANNVFINGQNFKISYGSTTTPTTRGIYSNGNYTVLNNISLEKSVSTEKTIMGIELVNNKKNKLENITVSNSKYGLYLSNSNSNQIKRINSKNNDYSGIIAINSNKNYFSNILTSDNIQNGIYIISTNNNYFENITLERNNIGLLFETNSTNNSLNKIYINNNIINGIKVVESENNTFSQITANRNSDKDFYFAKSDNTLIKDSFNITYYSKDYQKSKLQIENSTYGKIEFIEKVYTDKYYYYYTNLGKNILEEIKISNNSIEVNSTKNPYLNVPAKITLYNLPIIENPVIFKNGIFCTTCYNYTPLNQPNVSFYVAGFSNYSIESQISQDYLSIGIASPTNFNYTDRNQTIFINVESSNPLSKIWYNYNGSNMTYTEPTEKLFEEGENILHAWANNSKGNMTYTNITFFIDSISPEINIVSPQNGEYQLGNILLNVSHSEDTHYIWYNYNGTEVEYVEPINITLEIGEYTIIVGAVDSFGNEIESRRLIEITREEQIIENPSESNPSRGGGGGNSKINESKKELIQKENENIIEEKNFTEELSEKETDEKKLSVKKIEIIIIMTLIILPLLTLIYIIVKKISRHQ